MRGSRLVTTERVVCIAAPGTEAIVESVAAVVEDHGLSFVSFGVDETVLEEVIVGGDVLGVVVGGDGTFLRAVKEFAPREIPLVSVDAGTLGFLTVTPPDSVKVALEEILRGRGTIAEHLQVSVQGPDIDQSGINEVQFDAPPCREDSDGQFENRSPGGGTSRWCQLDVAVDGEYVGTYDGRGLLVNTPTGSTAMALSADGPVHYAADNETLQLTPLHIENAGVEPLVVHADAEVTIAASTPVRVSVDGARPEQIHETETTFTVTRADVPVYLVRSSQSQSLMDALSTKLGWSIRTDPPVGPGREDSRTQPDFYTAACHVAREAAFAAGEPVRRMYDRIDESDTGLVSDELLGTALSRSERIITAILNSEFPDHTIVSEGWTVSEGSEPYTWIIDPLDGTGNFAHGNPSFTVAIALVENSDPVVGVVYSPVTDDLFQAARGQGAQRNGSAIEPTDRSKLDESMLLSGYDPTGEFLKRFYRRARGVRRLGSASLHLCYVAAGSADAHWEYDTYPWDVAAGLCILREAGGVATDDDGEEYVLQLDDIGSRAPLLASNGPLHGELLPDLPEERF